jgi:hypothetical protein
VQGRASTNALADRARALFREDARLSGEYHALGGGKWNHMMDQARLGYTYWQQPVRNAMPAIQEVQVPPAGEMGVALEGAEASWPDGGGGRPVLPALSVYDRQPRYIDVFNRGREPFSYSIDVDTPWLEVDAKTGTIDGDRRVLVSARWNEVPIGAEPGSLTISGPNGVKVQVSVPVLNPATPRPEQLDGFVEANGYVSVEAEHYTRAAAPPGREWRVIPDHGRTLSGVMAWPVAPGASVSPGDGLFLEYRAYLFTKGKVNVNVHLAPTQKFQPGAGFRYAVAFDDEAPVVVNMHGDESLQAWERSVADGVKVLTTAHAVASPGYHVLKFWPLDTGVVLQKIVIDTGRARPSYLGPPESPHGPAPR